MRSPGLRRSDFGRTFGASKFRRTFAASKFRRAFGASKFRRTFGATPASTIRPVAAGRSLTATRTTRTGTTAGRVARGFLSRTLGTRAGDIALIDPDLDPDPTEGGLGLVEAVVDVGPQGVQRHLSLAVELRATHLSTAQTTRALNSDTPAPERIALCCALRIARRNCTREASCSATP